MKTPTYRRRLGSDTWHFVRACRWWPGARDSVCVDAKPTNGEFCNECLAKSKRSKAK